MHNSADSLFPKLAATAATDRASALEVLLAATAATDRAIALEVLLAATAATDRASALEVLLLSACCNCSQAVSVEGHYKRLLSHHWTTTFTH